MNWKALAEWQQWALGISCSLVAAGIVWLIGRFFWRKGGNREEPIERLPKNLVQQTASPVITQTFQPTINFPISIHPEGRPSTTGSPENLHTLEAASNTAREILRARAFLLSWRLTLLAVRKPPHPGVIEAEIRIHAAELGLILPESWRQDIADVSSTGRFQLLIEDLTGQLLGRNPQLALYFEAGYNLVLCSTGPELDRVKRVKAAIARLELPKQLSESREDVLSWLNEIQTHFANMLRQHVS